MGENITTRGIDLLALPTGTLLRIGHEATVEITGLRNPCGQLEGVRSGLQAAVLGRDEDGSRHPSGGRDGGGDRRRRGRRRRPGPRRVPSVPHQPLAPV